MTIKLKDIIDIISDHRSYSIFINGNSICQKDYIKKNDITYGMLQMTVVCIGTCLHSGEEHLVIKLEDEK